MLQNERPVPVLVLKDDRARTASLNGFAVSRARPLVAVAGWAGRVQVFRLSDELYLSQRDEAVALRNWFMTLSSPVDF
jgi:hypothetical protein